MFVVKRKEGEKIMAKYSVDSKGNVTVSGTTIGQAKAAGYQSVTAFEQAVNTGQAPPTVPIQTGTRLSTGGSVYVSPSTGSTTVVQSTPSGSVSYNPQTQTYTNEAGKTEQLSSEQASQKVIESTSVPKETPKPITISEGTWNNYLGNKPVSGKVMSEAEQAIQTGNIASRLAKGENVSIQEKKSIQPLFGKLNFPMSEIGADARGLYAGSAASAIVTPEDLVLYGGVAKLSYVGIKSGITVASTTISRGGVTLPTMLNIGQKGFVNVAGKSSKETAEQALKTKLLNMSPGARALYQPTAKEAIILEKSLSTQLTKEIATTSTPKSTLELIKQVKIPLIDKVFPSLGEKGAINFSGGLGSRYSGGIVSESIGLAKQAAPKITSNKFFLPLATLGFGLAAPEASVAISKTTTQKPARYDAEQLESPGFTTGGIESVYREVETTKTFGKEGGLQIKETQKVYEPRPEVWGVNVPMFGRLTAYSAVPSVVVDVFTGGAYQKGFKKGVKEKALGLGYSEVEAQQAADYAYATQGQARSIGETVGIIPIAITGEGLAQGLIKPGAQKLSSYIIPLGVGGAVEGAGFSYLSSQAQTGKIEPISIALGAGLGAGSAVGFGLPLVKWTQQAAIEKTVINTGTQTIAKKGFISAGTKATVGKGVLYAADWTEAFGDKGFAVGAKALGIRAVSTGTRVAVPTFTPSLTPIPTTTTNYTPTSAFTPTTTSTSIFTPTTTSTTTFNPTPTQTNIYNITPSTTFTPLETPTQTNTNTITPTLTTTPTQTSTFTPTFSPNLPILPFFGMPSGEISSGSSKKKKTKYYNELSSALGAFHSLDFGAKRTKRKKRTINIAGEMYYLGKKVKKAKRK